MIPEMAHTIYIFLRGDSRNDSCDALSWKLRMIKKKRKKTHLLFASYDIEIKEHLK